VTEIGAIGIPLLSNLVFNFEYASSILDIASSIEFE
jgi:hypothetical protein